jgi:hypothetical protein
MLTQKMPKNAELYECKFCDFKCYKKSNFSTHLSTLKHRMLTNVDNFVPKNATPLLQCSCGKEYKYRQSLSVHKKKCQKAENGENGENEVSTDKEIIKFLIKENYEFKNMILDVVKSVQTTNTINNTNTHNTTNNNFNLQFFLNDTCKDAINLVDFVESLQVQLKDLEETGKLGYSEGVSRIFINGLNELDVNKRPIHCSDAKRETLYIKDQDEWTKEDTNKPRLSKAIKSVSNKNIKQIFEWQKKYPDFSDPNSKQSDRYMEMICNTMSGSSKEEQDKNMNKIIKNITKEVIIDKI